MDEATLTIRFRDESSPGAGGAAAISPVGSEQLQDTVRQLQEAITQAGGVGALAAKNNTFSTGVAAQPPIVTPAQVPAAAPLPIPSATAGAAASTDPLLQTVISIAQADPKVTAEELVAALGLKPSQAASLLAAATSPGGATAPPSGPPAVPSGSSAPPPPDDLDLLIRRNRRLMMEEQERIREEAESARATAQLGYHHPHLLLYNHHHCQKSYLLRLLIPHAVYSQQSTYCLAWLTKVDH